MGGLSPIQGEMTAPAIGDNGAAPGAAAPANDLDTAGASSTPAAPLVDGDGNVIENPVPNLEDEEEVLVQFELPSAGERYVYAANPDNNSVAVIDSETLAIQTVEAGDEPTFLQTLGGRDAAIVLNVNSDDATIVRTEAGVSRTTTVDVVGGSNAIAVAPDGKHAIVYFNVDLRSSGPSGSFQDLSVVVLEEGEDRSVGMTVGFRPSAVAFAEDSSRGFVVTEDGVSILDFEQIEEQGSHIARTVPLGAATEAESLDVSITPDGRYALARPAGEGVLRLADLRDVDAEVKTLDLTEIFAQATLDAIQRDAEARAAAAATDAGADADPEPSPAVEEESAEADAGPGPLELDGGVTGGAVGDAGEPRAADAGAPEPQPEAAGEPVEPAADPGAPPMTTEDLGELAFTEVTDVDLSPEGEFALAVVRDRRTVLKVPIPEAFDDIDLVSVITVGEEIVGSVNIAPNGERALLYTTAQDDNEHLSILEIESEEIQVVRLPKSVRAVTIAPDSSSALVVHKKLPGDPNQAGVDPDTLIDRAYGYSVLQLEDGFSKLQLTNSDLGPSTIVPDGSYMFILFNDRARGSYEVHRVGLRNFLVDPVQLGSPPVSVGAVPGTSKVFVGQEHPDGRITFIDWATAATESVTGFELNSRIRE
jgi:YVTN family beta-propeller protein